MALVSKNFESLATTHLIKFKTKPSKRRNSTSSLPKSINNGIKGRHKKRTRSLTDYSSSSVLHILKNGLNQMQKQKMKKLSIDLKTERDIKHLRVKLSEAEEQRDTSIQIISNLKEENEDYLSQMDTLKSTILQFQTEIKILQQKFESLRQSYKEQKQRQKNCGLEYQETIKQLKETNEQQKLLILQHQQQTKQLNELTEQNSKNEQNTKEFKNQNNGYYALYMLEKSQSAEKDEKLSQLFSKLQDYSTIVVQKEDLEKKLASFTDMAYDDSLAQNQTRQRMEKEVINLASRNAELEKDKEDLVELLQQRDYEAEILKQQLEYVNASATVDVPGLNPIAKSDNIYHSGLNLEEEIVDEVDDEDNFKSHNNSMHDMGEKKKDVPDVMREYLHIAASAILIKHPKVTNVSSNELIKQVKVYPFEDYYDTMLKIVKSEETKILKKEIGNDDEKQKSSGLFGFLFGASSDATCADHKK